MEIKYRDMNEHKTAVYGHCKHGRSMITCDECSPKKANLIEVSKEDKEQIEKAFKNAGHDIEVIGQIDKATNPK